VTWPAFINILITDDSQAFRVNQLSQEFERERKHVPTREELYQRMGELMELIREYNNALPAGEATGERPAPSLGTGVSPTVFENPDDAVWQQPNWDCPRCTWNNFPIRTKCRNCGGPKPGTANEEPKAEPRPAACVRGNCFLAPDHPGACYPGTANAAPAQTEPDPPEAKQE
jgi:Zn-finger in Ran binding protein and others